MSLPLTSSVPSIFLLQTHLEPSELRELEDRIPSLTNDINEAEIVLGKVSRKQRALFELRRLKLDTEPLEDTVRPQFGSVIHEDGGERDQKRQKVSPPASATPQSSHRKDDVTIKVLNLSWFTDSMREGSFLPMKDYIVYEGKKIPQNATQPPSSAKRSTPSAFERAANDSANMTPQSPQSPQSLPSQRSQIKDKSISPATLRSPTVRKAAKRGLSRESTPDHDVRLPPVPDFLNSTYSCQRPTPSNPPNMEFLEELKTIRRLRLLRGDKIGVRAYSTSISTIASYPHRILKPQEVSRLPGCGSRIAELYQEWDATGQTAEVRNSELDPKVKILKLFYDIWGVGEVHAREFYEKGWRDLDDVVEYGWKTLSRVQQIGVKYYAEFQQKIGRKEVRDISEVILDHARRLNGDYEIMAVGGYRRGRTESGDVDVILSHKEEGKTLNLIEPLVLSLEKEHYITHTLTLSTRNTERGQVPLPWKGEATTWGTGFDTLDKAMVVWQEPNEARGLHRRVDIIVSPWKTVGCAILGWSGETTFQRDLRRYCKQEKGLKFDSSGIRNRSDGAWVDLERGEHPASTMEEAERRVFHGLGLTWRPPSERCTG